MRFTVSGRLTTSPGYEQVFGGPQAGGGMPEHSPIHIHIRVSLGVWFCDHFEWWLRWLLKRGWGVPPVI